MEIAPVPHRATRGEWRRLALGLLVLVPVVLLVLLPTVLGLDRYVVTDDGMDGSLGRGSVVLARQVPAADLGVGDVITFTPPHGGSDERVVRRIAAVDDEVAVTRGGEPSDTIRVHLKDDEYARVTLGVPWIGYPFLMNGGWVLLVLAAVLALVAAVVAGRWQPPRGSRATRSNPRTKVVVG